MGASNHLRYLVRPRSSDRDHYATPQHRNHFDVDRLILNAVNIQLDRVSQHLQNMGGQIFTIFVITTRWRKRPGPGIYRAVPQ
jgi:hypothetical protein